MTLSIPKKHIATPAGRFLAAFFDAVGAPAIWILDERLVVWPVGATLHHLRAHAEYGDLPGAPRINRIAVNCGTFEPTRRDLLCLGLRPTDRLAPRRDLALELTVLDEEIALLPGWLASCLAGRIDPRRMIPPPPIETDLVTEEDLHAKGEVWSVAARDALRAWRAQEAVHEEVRSARWQAYLFGGAPPMPRGSPGAMPATSAASPTCSANRIPHCGRTSSRVPARSMIGDPARTTSPRRLP